MREGLVYQILVVKFVHESFFYLAEAGSLKRYILKLVVEAEARVFEHPQAVEQELAIVQSAVGLHVVDAYQCFDDICMVLARDVEVSLMGTLLIHDLDAGVFVVLLLFAVRQLLKFEWSRRLFRGVRQYESEELLLDTLSMQVGVGDYCCTGQMELSFVTLWPLHEYLDSRQ